jgi:C-terminal processing protease CtpA/Prc
MKTNNDASLRGRELYHAIWEMVNVAFFDTTRLADWGSYEHKFDEQIVDEETALSCADEMLASLGDTYTERVVPPQTFVSPSSADEPAAADEKAPDVEAFLAPNGIAYLRISTFDKEGVIDEIAAAVEKIAACKGVILDLRGNSGGRMQEALEACGFFLKEGLLATLKFRWEEGVGVKVKQYFVNEDQYFEIEELPNGERSTRKGTRRPPLLAGKPLVILMNRRTASAGELTICALVQNGIAGQVSIVGSGQTPGKGIGQAEYDILDGKTRLRVTRCHWFAPGGEWLGDCGQTEANGIEPEISVEDDHGPEGLKAAADELKKMLGIPLKSAVD